MSCPPDERELYDEIEAVKAKFPKGGGPIPPGTGPVPSSDLTQAYLFLQPLTKPGKHQHFDDTPPPPVPQFDFHQAVSLLGRHPALLRLFGLVYELEVARPGGLSGTVAVSVIPSWKPKLGGPPHTTDVEPVTMTDASEWIPAHRAAEPEITSGFMRFSDPDYEVMEMDLDGATLKAFNFVQGIQRANTEMASADTPTQLCGAVAALGRPVGRQDRESPVALPELAEQQRLQRRHRGVAPGPVRLYFEDIAQGYRVDVWSKAPGPLVPAVCPHWGEESRPRRLRHRLATGSRARARRRRGLGRARDDPECHLDRTEPAGIRT